MVADRYTVAPHGPTGTSREGDVRPDKDCLKYNVDAALPALVPDPRSDEADGHHGGGAGDSGGSADPHSESGAHVFAHPLAGARVRQRDVELDEDVHG